MKEERLQLIPQKYKDYKKLLWRTVCQEIWKPGWNGHISTKDNLPKLNEEEAENLNRPITTDEIETVIKKLQHTETLDWMVSQKNSTKHLRKS